MKTKKDYSTREIIISEAVEMLNEVGMVDFRIDDLAKRLNLSPGNITYHFSKKEELSNAIWHKFCERLLSLDIMITKIIDLKQFFLYLKSVLDVIYDYRGIVMYRSGDIRQLFKDYDDEKSYHKIIDKDLNLVFDYFIANSLFEENIKPSQRELVNKTVSKLILMWLNRELLYRGMVSVEDVNRKINENVLLILQNYTRYFTADAKRQYTELVATFEKDNA